MYEKLTGKFNAATFFIWAVMASVVLFGIVQLGFLSPKDATIVGLIGAIVILYLG